MIGQKEIQEKLNNPPKPKYLYQRYNGEIRKYEAQDNILINVKNANDIINLDKQIILGKISENIIDLIEEGDYVNGSKVIEVDNCEGAMREVYIEGQNPDKDCGLYFEQIENIVTKEQFNEVKYEV